MFSVLLLLLPPLEVVMVVLSLILAGVLGFLSVGEPELVEKWVGDEDGDIETSVEFVKNGIRYNRA